MIIEIDDIVSEKKNPKNPDVSNFRLFKALIPSIFLQWQEQPTPKSIASERKITFHNNLIL